MYIYSFFNIYNVPDLEDIHSNIVSNEVLNLKNFVGLKYDKCSFLCENCNHLNCDGFYLNSLKVFFENELSTEDKQILDGIVENNLQ